ncbi:MAG: hypothetical protein EZS28_035641, partial [Streblomastix strix]
EEVKSNRRDARQRRRQREQQLIREREQEQERSRIIEREQVRQKERELMRSKERKKENIMKYQLGVSLSTLDIDGRKRIQPKGRSELAISDIQIKKEDSLPTDYFYTQRIRTVDQNKETNVIEVKQQPKKIQNTNKPTSMLKFFSLKNEQNLDNDIENNEDEDEGDLFQKLNQEKSPKQIDSNKIVRDLTKFDDVKTTGEEYRTVLTVALSEINTNTSDYNQNKLIIERENNNEQQNEEVIEKLDQISDENKQTLNKEDDIVAVNNQQSSDNARKSSLHDKSEKYNHSPLSKSSLPIIEADPQIPPQQPKEELSQLIHITENTLIRSDLLSSSFNMLQLPRNAQSQSPYTTIGTKTSSNEDHSSHTLLSTPLSTQTAEAQSLLLKNKRRKSKEKKKISSKLGTYHTKFAIPPHPPKQKHSRYHNRRNPQSIASDHHFNVFQGRTRANSEWIPGQQMVSSYSTSLIVQAKPQNQNQNQNQNQDHTQSEYKNQQDMSVMSSSAGVFSYQSTKSDQDHNKQKPDSNTLQHEDQNESNLTKQSSQDSPDQQSKNNSDVFKQKFSYYFDSRSTYTGANEALMQDVEDADSQFSIDSAVSMPESNQQRNQFMFRVDPEFTDNSIAKYDWLVSFPKRMKSISHYTPIIEKKSSRLKKETGQMSESQLKKMSQNTQAPQTDEVIIQHSSQQSSISSPSLDNLLLNKYSKPMNSALSDHEGPSVFDDYFHSDGADEQKDKNSQRKNSKRLSVQSLSSGGKSTSTSQQTQSDGLQERSKNDIHIEKMRSKKPQIDIKIDSTMNKSNIVEGISSNNTVDKQSRLDQSKEKQSNSPRSYFSEVI